MRIKLAVVPHTTPSRINAISGKRTYGSARRLKPRRRLGSGKIVAAVSCCNCSHRTTEQQGIYIRSGANAVRRSTIFAVSRGYDPLFSGLEAANQHVDEVLPSRGADAVLAKHADQLALGNGLRVGADEDLRDGTLHAGRLGIRERARELFQYFAVGDVEAPERVESAHL